MIVAVIVFSVGLYYSITNFQISIKSINILPLILLVFVLIPLTQLFNAYEILLTGKLVGKTFKIKEAFKVSVFATAANLLPLPGSVIVKSGVLKLKGTTTKESLKAPFVVGLIWLFVSFAYSAIFAFGKNIALAILFGSASVIVLFVVLLLVSNTFIKYTIITKLVILKLMATIVETMRLFLAFSAISVVALFSDTAILSAASVIGSAIMIFPGGLGIREAATAGLGHMIGISTYAAFLAAAINRIAAFFVLIPLSCIMALWKDMPDNDLQ